MHSFPRKYYKRLGAYHTSARQDLLHVKYGNGIIDSRYEKVQVLSKGGSFFAYDLKK